MVFDHSTWAERNPGKCTTKIEMPWEGDGPELGKQLHGISSGRIKFRPEQIRHLQGRFTDEEIIRGFRRLLAQGRVPLDRHGFIDMTNVGWTALCQAA